MNELGQISLLTALHVWQGKYYSSYQWRCWRTEDWRHNAN